MTHFFAFLCKIIGHNWHRQWYMADIDFGIPAMPTNKEHCWRCGSDRKVVNL